LAEAGKSDLDAVRFRAFVSYSHADAAIAQRLHRKIETYQLPRRLQSDSKTSKNNGRLGRIFRDREDLPAAEDLSESVKQALAGSQVLVVVCSPDARESIWVAREIELFRSLHPGRPVLAALVRGEPEEAFPPALLDGAEPLAADLRKQGDGWRLGFLKIVAGIAGVPLDALVQRDAARRIRRVMAVTGGALVALLAMIGMTIFAIQSRNEALHQQAEAEGLVEYMLTDLRTELKGVGRLDVMTKVNERAMDYYEDQDDLSAMPAESLERRARILHAMGEDDEKRGDLDKALAKFTEAHRVTEALLARDPEQPDRIFAHAQSENWLGYFAYWRKDYKEARLRTAQNKALVAKLMRLPKKRPDWVRHAGYSYGSECARLLTTKTQPRRALDECSAALEYIEELTGIVPDDHQAVSDLANRHAWLADAYFANGMIEKGFAHRKEQIRLVDGLVERDPKNHSWLEQRAVSQMSYAELLIDYRRENEAREYARRSLEIANRLFQYDPKNSKYEQWKKRLESLNSMMEK
jgi:tetratricopeptide (TPR) repeat protein|tara:strand:+ start:68079 stop:69650 length:1572 start_codon:yes stop_codon:yes gene_type:complete